MNHNIQPIVQIDGNIYSDVNVPNNVVNIGNSNSTTTRLTITTAPSSTGLDLSTADSVAEMRVIRNSSSSADKDIYIGHGSGSNSSTHIYSDNTETITVSDDKVGLGIVPTTKLDIKSLGNATKIVRVLDNNNNDIANINNNGSVGFGVQSPTEVLELGNSVKTNLKFVVSGNTIGQLGNVVLSGQNSSDLGINATNKLVLGAGTTIAATISGGNIGIGKEPTTYLLDVNGNINAPAFVGNLSGTARDALKLTNSKNINGIAFDGTSDITIYDSTKVALTAVGVSGGIVPLNSNGLIDTTYLPSYVDDVLEFASLSAFPNPGETGKIYIALDSNFTYRWSGSIYVNIGGAGGGSVISVNSRTGIITLSASDVGLANVDNTSDLNKPISNATLSALNLKLDTSAYTANDVLTKIKTVDGTGSGLDADYLDGLHSTDFSLSGHNHSGTYQPLDNTLTALAGVSTSADMLIYSTGTDTFSATPLTQQARNFLDDTTAGYQRITIGLGNVDNTADVDKPISNATLSALNLKLDTSAYTANDVLTKIKTVDGTGSGLDADYLDGLDSLAFAPSAHNHTYLSGITSLNFNTTAGVPVYSEGNIYWDAADHCLTFQTEISATSIQIGQEQVVRIVNKTESIIADGATVVLSGAQGNRPCAVLANATTELGSYVLGVATATIGINDEGYVTVNGIVRGYDTRPFNAGDILYVDPNNPGGLTNVRPLAPNHWCIVGHALNSTVNGSIYVSINVGHELDELHDVLLSGKVDLDVLTYETSSGLWKNKQITKAQVGLGNVDNTADVDKPISNATLSALNLKLDTSAYTANDVLTKIKTVDGTGSGLDADYLDGLDSLAFSLSGHTHTGSSLNYIPENGFEDRTNSTLSMSTSTFQITTGSSYNIYSNAVKYTKNTTQSVPIANDLTQHFVYFDTSGTLQVATSAWNILSDNIPVATVFKDGTNYSVGEERHGYKRNREWHNWAHKTIFTRYESGYTGTFGDSSLSVTQGVVWDEDIDLDSLTTKTNCAIWYRNTGATQMRYLPAQTVPYKATAGVLEYDNNGTLTPIGTGQHVANYVYATNDINYPIGVIVSQGVYTTSTQAEAAALPSIPLSTTEWKLLYRVVYRNNSGTATYISAQDFRNVSTGPANAATSTDHQTLTNRDAANAHPQNSITGLTTSDTVSFAGVNVTTSTIPTNGIYLPSANTLGIASSGILQWKIDSSGNETVSGGITAKNINVNSATLPANGMYLKSSNVLGFSTNSVERVSIGSSGNLLVTGNITGTSLIPNSSTVPTNGMYYPATNSIGIATSGVNRLTIDSSGNLTEVGNVTANALIPSSSTVPTNGMYLPAANTLGLATSGVQCLQFNSTGRMLTNNGIDIYNEIVKKSNYSYNTLTYNAGIVWSTRTSANSNDWRSVCWSPELRLFCAVAGSGSSNRVMTSPDGINWTARTSAADNTWNSVCWSPELRLFCAVAFDGLTNCAMTSPDGINWTARTTPSNNWNSVCWSPELRLFCSIAYSGSGNRVMTSPDGINWTNRTSAADNSWNWICWSPELRLFCAIATSGSNSRVMTSPDGITWTIRTSAADNGWAKVCWSPELRIFCAVAYNGTNNGVMTSPDGINWTARTPAANIQWQSVCWAPELKSFFAIANSGSGNRAMTSPDGINWTIRTSAADNNWLDICYSPELQMVCAVSYSGSGNRVMTTTASETIISTNTGIGASSPLSARLDVKSSGGSTKVIRARNSSDSEIFVVNDDSTSTIGNLNVTSSSLPTNGMYLPATNSLGFSTSGTNRLTLDSTGTLNVANRIKVVSTAAIYDTVSPTVIKKIYKSHCKLTTANKNRLSFDTSSDNVLTPNGTYPGDFSFAGGVLLPDGRVFCVPSSTTTSARIYDPTTDTLITPTGSYSTNDFGGGVLLSDGRVFCIPYSSTSSKIYDPVADTLTATNGVYPGSGAFIGGVLLPDGRVFCVPYNSTSSRIYDPVGNTLSTPTGTYPGSGAFTGGVLLPDGRVFCVPSNSTSARIYDPVGDTLSTPTGVYPGTYAFSGGVLLPDGRVFCVPSNSTSARIYDPVGDTLSTPSGTYPGTYAFTGGVLLPDGRVFCVPSNSASARIYDPVSDTLSTPSGTYPGNYAFNRGTLLPDGRVFCVPYNSTSSRIAYGSYSHSSLNFPMPLLLGGTLNKL